MIAAKFDDGGRHDAVGFASVEDQREAIAELVEDFAAAGAGGRAGNVGAGAGKRNADFRDQVGDDFGFGPAHGDAAGVASDLQGEPVGGVDDDGKRTGPARFGESIKIVGKILRNNQSVIERADEDGKRALFGASFDAKNFFDGGEVDGIGSEGVESVGGNGDDGSAVEPGRGIADDTRVGIGRADFENFS